MLTEDSLRRVLAIFVDFIIPLAIPVAAMIVFCKLYWAEEKNRGRIGWMIGWGVAYLLSFLVLMIVGAILFLS